MAIKYPQLPYSLGRKTSLCKAQLPPACRTGGALPAPPLLPRAGKPFSPCLQRHPRPTPSLKHNPTRFTSTLSSRKSPQSLSPSSSSIPLSPSNYTRVSSTTLVSASSPISTAYASPNDDPVKAKLAQDRTEDSNTTAIMQLKLHRNRVT